MRTKTVADAGAQRRQSGAPGIGLGKDEEEGKRKIILVRDQLYQSKYPHRKKKDLGMYRDAMK